MLLRFSTVQLLRVGCVTGGEGVLLQTVPTGSAGGNRRDRDSWKRAHLRKEQCILKVPWHEKKQIVKSVTQSENSGKQLDDVDRGDKKIIFFRWWNFKEKKYKEFSIHSSSPILNFFFFTAIMRRNEISDEEVIARQSSVKQDMRHQQVTAT